MSKYETYIQTSELDTKPESNLPRQALRILPRGGLSLKIMGVVVVEHKNCGSQKGLGKAVRDIHLRH